jgi:hypothetical protein
MSLRADKDDVPEFGPHMLALANDRQRKFVAALYDEDAPIKGAGLLLYAARKAGYGNAQGTTTDQALSVIASRIVHDERVQAAIAEYSRTTIRAISPEAIRALREVIRDPKHRDHMRAISAIADRVYPIEQTHTVKVEDNRPPSIEATERVLARINELAVRAGLPPLPAPSPVIEDVDYEAVIK